MSIKPTTMGLDAKCHRRMSFAYPVIVEAIKTHVYKKALAALHQVSCIKTDHILKQIINGQSAPHLCQRGKQGRSVAK